MSDKNFLNSLNENIDYSDDSTSFNIDSESEEELDFDLDELINKIDAKIEELNNENDSDEKKTIKITDNSEFSKEEEYNRNVEKDYDTNVDYDNFSSEESEPLSENNGEEIDSSIKDIINKIDAKMEELNLTNEIKDEDNNVNFEVKEELDAVAGDNKIEDKDINNLFDKVSNNVKEASNIFVKNIEMKKKLDTRFEELKKLQKEIEASKQNNYKEINDYKDSVLEELTAKKNEIEKRLNELKDLQSKFEKEKSDFENYKIESKKEIEDLSREQKVKDESRKEELENLEDKLRKQKDSLDEEKRQLSLDRIQYEADKNELANNMLKFNEIVGTFTDGVGNLN